jgi:hypothetical protein
VKLEGSMSLEQRNRTIDEFTHNPDVVVFLMSLKAGGVALNLTAARYVAATPATTCTGLYRHLRQLVVPFATL